MSTWNLDHAHSVIGFKVKHLMVSTVSGFFGDFTGSIESADDSFENAQVRFEAQVASINTRNDMRDGHLRTSDFFDTEHFPTLSFVSHSFKKEGDHFVVTGDFTMRGITKSLTFTATTDGLAKNINSARVVGFDITGSLNRQDFGVSWNNIIEAGGVTVSDEVKFDIHVEAIEA